MARRNGIWYEGRLVNNKDQSKLRKAKTGKLVLDLVIAEQFSERNDKAPDKFKDGTKPADAYVNTTTAWHKIRAFGDADNAELLALVTNPLFNHGAILTIDTSYREEEPWEDRGGVLHAGRQESVFFGTEDGGTIEIKVSNSGNPLGARDEWAKPLWDGKSDLPMLGGGAPKATEYSDNEGF